MAEATDRRWGVWHASKWCRNHNNQPVTYQEAVVVRDELAKLFTGTLYEVREVPIPHDAYDSSSSKTPSNLRPYVPPALQPRSREELPFLLGGDLLTDQLSLAKLLFFSDRAVRNVVFEATGSAPASTSLERAWELGKTNSRTATNVERASYRAAVDRAAAIFALLEASEASLKAPKPSSST